MKTLIAFCLMAPFALAEIREIRVPPVEFESGHTYYIHPEAIAITLQDTATYTFTGLENVELYFMAPISGNVKTAAAWSDVRGVVNFVDCKNIVVGGLDVTNRYLYSPTDTSVGMQESTAVNVSRCKNMMFKNCRFKGEGKTVFVVHSDSNVTLRDSVIDSYYFSLAVGASDVALSNVTMTQKNDQAGDIHAAIWVSSTARNHESRQLYSNTNVWVHNTTFELLSGRALVCGNGSYETESVIKFSGKTSVLSDKWGYAMLNKNYHSITVYLNGDYPKPDGDFPSPAVGRFYKNTFQGGGRPSSESPIKVFEATSSDDVKLD